MKLWKPCLVLVVLVALVVGLFSTTNDLDAAPVSPISPAPVAQGIDPVDPCGPYCAQGPIDCPPPPTCEGVLNLNCYTEACIAYQNAIMACRAFACQECTNEHAYHAAYLAAFKQELLYCKMGCAAHWGNIGPDYEACVAACQLEYESECSAEGIRHSRRLASIGNQLSNCQLLALVAFYAQLQGCCE